MRRSHSLPSKLYLYTDWKGPAVWAESPNHFREMTGYEPTTENGLAHDPIRRKRA